MVKLVGENEGTMWYPHHGYSWETMIFGGLMMVLFWGGLVVLAVWLFRASVGSNANRNSDNAEAASHHRPTRDALDILKERYARGEISKTEFEQIRDDLRA